MIKNKEESHNPYFNRWFSAIRIEKWLKYYGHGHNPYFNRWFSAIYSSKTNEIAYKSHNPYFNRWFSAIELKEVLEACMHVTILILIDGFLQ